MSWRRCQWPCWLRDTRWLRATRGLRATCVVLVAVDCANCANSALTLERTLVIFYDLLSHTNTTRLIQQLVRLLSSAHLLPLAAGRNHPVSGADRRGRT